MQKQNFAKNGQFYSLKTSSQLREKALGSAPETKIGVRVSLNRLHCILQAVCGRGWRPRSLSTHCSPSSCCWRYLLWSCTLEDQIIIVKESKSACWIPSISRYVNRFSLVPPDKLCLLSVCV